MEANENEMCTDGWLAKEEANERSEWMNEKWLNEWMEFNEFSTIPWGLMSAGRP